MSFVTEAVAHIHGEPFEFAPGPPPPPGNNWAFIASGERTGSNALAKFLSLHRDCYIGNELGGPLMLMRTFSTQYYAVLGAEGFIRHGHLSAAEVRRLCETWREVRSDGERIVGDKQINLWACREALREVFPGCHIIVTIRHPLDQLASTCAAPWGGPIANGSPEEKLVYLQQRCAVATGSIAAPDLHVVRFEDLAEGEDRLRICEKLWEAFGLPVGGELRRRILFHLLNAPEGTLGKWHKDVHVAAVLEHAPEAIEELVQSCGYTLT